MTRSTLTSQDYARALLTQGACNASGLILDLAKMQEKVNEDAHSLGQGTDWRNTHPIVVLYVAQLAHLTKLASIVNMEAYCVANRLCEHWAGHTPDADYSLTGVLA
jgi:hypothetical protein